MLGISEGKAKQTSPRVDLGLIVTILTKLKTDTFHGIFFLSLELWETITVMFKSKTLIAALQCCFNHGQTIHAAFS